MRRLGTTPLTDITSDWFSLETVSSIDITLRLDLFVNDLDRSTVLTGS